MPQSADDLRPRDGPSSVEGLLSSRFRPLRVPERRVDRQRLIDRLDEAVNHQLTVVTSPAGFGKSTLLAQWAAVSDLPVTWVSLTEAENDPHLLIAYLSAAIRAFAQTRPGSHTPDIEVHSADPSRSITELIDDLAGAATPIVLVLDDYHLISSDAAHSVILALIDHKPGVVRVIISGRSSTPRSLRRLTHDVQPQHIDANELRFTLAETLGFRDVMDVELSDDDVHSLHDRMDGWVAGLQMFAITLAEGEASGADLLHHFDASNQLVHDFLLQEVLDTQSSELQAFLLRTALFNRISSDLCREVLYPSPSLTGFLERVRESSLFLVPLDATGRWFAYQPLFREFLRQRANVILTKRERIVLYRRAGYWCEREGMTQEAIEYALAGEDWAHAAMMIVPAVSAMFGREEIATALGWLRALPEQLIASDAELAVIAAWAHLRSGALADVAGLLAPAQQIYEETNDALGLAHVYCAYAELNRYYADGLLTVQYARQAQDFLAQHERQTFTRFPSARLPTADPVQLGRGIDALARIQAGSGLFRQGRADDAAQELLAAHAYTVAHNTPIYEAMLMLQLGHVRMLQGRLDDATACYDAIPTSPDMYIVSRRLALTRLAEIKRERHQFEYAQQLLEECQENIENSPLGFGLWDLRMAQARLAWSRRATDQALEYADLAVGRARSAGLAWHTSIAEAFAVRVRLSHGDIGTALEWAFDRRLASDDVARFEQLHEHLVYARMLIAQGDPQETTGLLTRCLANAEDDGRIGDAIEISALLALAHLESGNLNRATDAIRRALQHGERGGYLHVFADNGLPMMQLLEQVQGDGISSAYRQRILDILGEPQDHVSMDDRGSNDDPISVRELDVLRLIASGQSNVEIANTMGISGFTVTRHIESLHGKLGVWTHAEALYKARALGLLSVNDDATHERDTSATGVGEYEDRTAS